jgi:ATP-binding cassette, subfamily B (MDR/TAP), member 1
MLEDNIDSNALLESEQLRKAEAQAPEEAPRTIPFTKFFTYLTGFDKLLLVIGTICAIIAGAILPSISLVMGNVAVAFSNDSGSSSSSEADSTLMDIMSTIAAIVMMIAMALFIFSYVFFAFW